MTEYGLEKPGLRVHVHWRQRVWNDFSSIFRDCVYFVNVR